MWPFKKNYKTYNYLVSYSCVNKKKEPAIGRILMSAACFPNEALLTIFEDDIEEEEDLDNVTILALTLLENLN